ncbi:hypothetical protein ACTXT7_009752 [Hymenolepis weldensis]
MYYPKILNDTTSLGTDLRYIQLTISLTPSGLLSYERGTNPLVNLKMRSLECNSTPNYHRNQNELLPWWIEHTLKV